MTTERSFYERLLDGISEGVHFMNRDRIIRYWNRGDERIAGFNKHEVIGTACRDNWSLAQYECTVNMDN
jgi:nitrogen fixation/metabolism regulation signal transduction histidine kinase